MVIYVFPLPPTCYSTSPENHIFVEGISNNIIIHGPLINQLLPSLKLTYCLKKGRAPKGKDRLPTIHFQGVELSVSVAGIFLRSRNWAHAGKLP